MKNFLKGVIITLITLIVSIFMTPWIIYGAIKYMYWVENFFR